MGRADRQAMAIQLRFVARTAFCRLWFGVFGALAGGAGAYAALALHAPSELPLPHARHAIAVTSLVCGLLAFAFALLQALAADRMPSVEAFAKKAAFHA